MFPPSKKLARFLAGLEEKRPLGVQTNGAAQSDFSLLNCMLGLFNA
jgi:hypothetical protein